MRRSTLKTVFAVLAVVCFCFALCLSPDIAIVDSDRVTITDVDVPTAAADGEVYVSDADVNVEASVDVAQPTVDTSKFDEEYLIKRFSSMLNINYCYGDAFRDTEKMAMAAAVTLSDYAADIPGVGLAVNTPLVDGFLKSFYGVEPELEDTAFDGFPDGYVAAPIGSVATQVHSVLSVEKCDQGFEVFSTVEFYYGGDDVCFSIARSVFTVNDESEFGFNLVLCELL